MSNFLLIFLGASIGALLRGFFQYLFGNKFGNSSTILINIFGCFIIGFLTTAFYYYDIFIEHNIKLYLICGILGGFTIFCIIQQLELFMHFQKKSYPYVLGYSICCLIYSFILVCSGIIFSKFIIKIL